MTKPVLEQSSSFRGEGLAPSPYEIAKADIEVLNAELGIADRAVEKRDEIIEKYHKQVAGYREDITHEVDAHLVTIATVNRLRALLWECEAAVEFDGRYKLAAKIRAELINNKKGQPSCDVSPVTKS